MDTTIELTTPFQLAKKFDVHDRVVNIALEQASLVPAFTHSAGKNVMRFYIRDKAETAVATYVGAQKINKSSATPPAPQLDDSKLDTVLRQLQGVLDRISDLEDSLAASFKLLQEQNACLLRAIEAVPTKAARALPLTAALQDKPDEQPPASEQKALLRVAIIGLLDSQIAEIKKEFAATHDVVHVEADEVRRPGTVHKLRNCEHVLAVVKFVGHDALSKLKSGGVNFIPLNGGMSTLRTELTRIYLAATSKAA